MKTFNFTRKVPALVALTFAAFTSAAISSCTEIGEDPTIPSIPDKSVYLPHSVTPESIARLLASIPIGLDQVKEVWSAVSASIGNGYDEEYMFSSILSTPGYGVGDKALGTRAVDYPNSLGSLISSYASDIAATRSGDFLSSLAESGYQIYWPYSEDWDLNTLPIVTFAPEDRRLESNVGYERIPAADGGWSVREVMVDENTARRRPVWVVNSNEDASFTTPEMRSKIFPESLSTKAYDNCKSLVMKEFKAHRNYDSWFAGASEFFVKCGAVEGFNASTEAEIKLYYPSVTDLVVVVRRKNVGKSLRYNAMLVSEWSPQLEESAFLIVEDDGGKLTSWKAGGTLKVKSKSYGFEVEIPLNRNDDIVWRGKLSSSYFERFNGKASRFGDVSVTFAFM